MGNKCDVRHYFAEGITARGYISLLPLLMEDWQRSYILLGGPGTGKSTLIKILGLELLDRGYEVDFIRSARDSDTVAGFLVPGTKLGMLDAVEVTPLRWRAPGVLEKFIDLTRYCDERKLEKQRKSILDIEIHMNECQESIEEQLLEMLEVHMKHQMGKHYSQFKSTDVRRFDIFNSMNQWNFEKAIGDAWPIAQDAIKKLQKSEIRPCFLHGLSPEGWLNLAPHYLSEYDQIRLEGEDTLEALNWILEEAQYLGQIIEIILHPINPDEIIGIVFPQRNLSIWQGNPDVLEDQGLAKPFSDKLKETLINWYNQRSALKNIYMDVVDFSQIDELREELLNKVLRDLEYV